jgi:tight adherence protein C
MPIAVILAAIALAASLPVLWWALASTRTPHRAAASNLLGGVSGPADLRQVVLAHSATDRVVQPLIGGLARRARRLTPKGFVGALERRIMLAGRPGSWTIERVLAAKLVLAAAGGAVALLVFTRNPSSTAMLIGFGLVAAGYFAPDVLLQGRAARRQLSIRNELPDTLDQVTICVEAGLGFDAALARAGRTGHGVMAEEIVRTLQEMQVGATRAQALRNLVGRTDVSELRHFVHALLQAESYGMPIADVLRVQAGELRTRRRQAAEEKAMKIPVKIVFPLIMCILPTLFIVMLGPAVMRIFRTFF